MHTQNEKFNKHKISIWQDIIKIFFATFVGFCIFFVHMRAQDSPSLPHIIIPPRLHHVTFNITHEFKSAKMFQSLLFVCLWLFLVPPFFLRTFALFLFCAVSYFTSTLLRRRSAAEGWWGGGGGGSRLGGVVVAASKTCVCGFFYNVYFMCNALTFGCSLIMCERVYVHCFYGF